MSNYIEEQEPEAGNPHYKEDKPKKPQVLFQLDEDEPEAGKPYYQLEKKQTRLDESETPQYQLEKKQTRLDESGTPQYQLEKRMTRQDITTEEDEEPEAGRPYYVPPKEDTEQAEQTQAVDGINKPFNAKEEYDILMQNIRKPRSYQANVEQANKDKKFRETISALSLLLNTAKGALGGNIRKEDYSGITAAANEAKAYQELENKDADRYDDAKNKLFFDLYNLQFKDKAAQRSYLQELEKIFAKEGTDARNIGRRDKATKEQILLRGEVDLEKEDFAQKGRMGLQDKKHGHNMTLEAFKQKGREQLAALRISLKQSGDLDKTFIDVKSPFGKGSVGLTKGETLEFFDWLRAFGMYLKTQFVQERSGGNNVIFATGTPITNTMAEIWTMMKFISSDVLAKYSMTGFDQFASTFGLVEPSLEYTTAGEFKIVQRFKTYINAPELLTAFRIKTHVVLTEDIPEFKEGNDIPKLKDNQFTQIIIPQSIALKRIMEEIKEELKRWEKLPGKEKRKNRSVPLVLFGVAKQAAIDQRLVNPNLPDDSGSKVNRVIDEVKRIYDDASEHKGAQLIFSDLIQSSKKHGDNRFHLYKEIKAKLISKGIPEHEIANIEDYKDAKREILFDKVCSGEIRVLIGGTEKMGIGVNVQERLAAIHHIDAPPRPMDFEQRNGRIIRQGNMFAWLKIPVEVVTYGVEKTLDATAYQRLAIKQAFINQMMKGKNIDREIGDYAEEDSVSDMTFQQMMSTLSGSQYAILHVQKSFDLQKLETAERNHKRRQVEINRSIKQDEEYIEDAKEQILAIKKASKTVDKYFKDTKIERITIDNKTYNEKLFTVIDDAIKKYFYYIAQSAAVSLSKVKPLQIYLNNYPSPLEIYIENILNMEYSYSMSIKGYEISGNTIRTGQGLISSIRARLVNIDGKEAELEKNIQEVEKRIPVLKEELKKPFDKQDKLNELLREVNELEDLMQQESEANNKKSKGENLEDEVNDGQENRIAEPFAPLIESDTEESSESPAETNIQETLETPEPIEDDKEVEPTVNSNENAANSDDLITPVDTYIHTKNNTEFCRVKLSKKVEKDVYYTISNIAKKHGKGYWSRFAKGFLFKTKEDAENFRKEVNSTTDLSATPVELGFSLKGIAEVLGFTKGTRPLDVRGGAVLKRFADREIYIKSLQNKIKELGGKVNSASDVYNDMTLSNRIRENRCRPMMLLSCTYVQRIL
ncbi:MAG: hypothetical protein LBG19_03215 [Prevotellaceae bacterium]|jgi:hypothetical protein|nr:hypothetical protein [Prevotellaceae bacterium]